MGNIVFAARHTAVNCQTARQVPIPGSSLSFFVFSKPNEYVPFKETFVTMLVQHIKYSFHFMITEYMGTHKTRFHARTAREWAGTPIGPVAQAHHPVSYNQLSFVAVIGQASFSAKEFVLFSVTSYGVKLWTNKSSKMKDRAGTLLSIKIKDFSHHRFKNFKDLIYFHRPLPNKGSDFYENSFVSPGTPSFPQCRFYPVAFKLVFAKVFWRFENVPRSKVKDFPGPKWMKKNFKHFERVEKNSKIQEFSRRVQPVREPS